MLYKFLVVSSINCKLFHWFASFKLQKEKKNAGEKGEVHVLYNQPPNVQGEKTISDSQG